MPDQSLLVPGAIEILDRQLRQPRDLAALYHDLRALQHLNLSKTDIQVHLERMKAVNEAADDTDPILQANCDDALDIVLGYAGDLSLKWDAGETARLLLPRCLDSTALDSALEFALIPSDLLPDRHLDVPANVIRNELGSGLSRILDGDLLAALPADIFRVPKDMLTSRPAALLAPADRICYEALATGVAEVLKDVAPASVVWPTSRAAGDYDDFNRRPLSWSHEYVIHADVESFYEHVDHSKLGIVLSAWLGTTSVYARCVEALLDAVMANEAGLPQGPQASDIFASCYLLFVDLQLEKDGVSYARYADDYRIGADSFLDARRKMDKLGSWLGDLGLSVNPRKTYIRRQESYRSYVTKGPSDRARRFNQRLAIAYAEMLEQDGTSRDRGLLDLEDIGAENSFYGGGVSLDEIIDALSAEDSPERAEACAAFVNSEAAELEDSRHPDDEDAEQADLKSAFLYLAGAEHSVEWRTVSTILLWYPALAPVCAAYLRRLRRSDMQEVKQGIREWLAPNFATDWVQAWGCAVVEAAPDVIDDEIAQALQTLALSTDAGPLTRAGALTALAASGRLTPTEYEAVTANATEAMGADLYLHQVAHSDRYIAAGIQAGELKLPTSRPTETPLASAASGAMDIDRDSGRGSYTDLSERDKHALREAELQGRHLLPDEMNLIERVTQGMQQVIGQSEEDYEQAVISELRLMLPPELVPPETAVRLFIAARRARLI